MVLKQKLQNTKYKFYHKLRKAIWQIDMSPEGELKWDKTSSLCLGAVKYFILDNFEILVKRGLVRDYDKNS